MAAPSVYTLFSLNRRENLEQYRSHCFPHCVPNVTAQFRPSSTPPPPGPVSSFGLICEPSKNSFRKFHPTHEWKIPPGSPREMRFEIQGWIRAESTLQKITGAILELEVSQIRLQDNDQMHLALARAKNNRQISTCVYNFTNKLLGKSWHFFMEKRKK